MRPLISSLKDGWSSASDGNVGIIAAGVAYYGFLALVPLLAAAILTYGLVTDPATIAEHVEGLAESLPGAAGELVSDQLRSVAASRGGAQGFGLVLALALSLIGARAAAGALVTALDIAFETEQERGFIEANLLALAIAAGAAVALGLVAAVTALVSTVLTGAASALGGYVVVGLAGLGGAAAAYRIAPDQEAIGWPVALRGGALFAAGWLVATAGFGFYASNFGNYNATYGSLGAVVVFLTWLWLSAWLLLLGAHFAAASVASRH
jgi:membrane protein